MESVLPVYNEFLALEQKTLNLLYNYVSLRASLSHLAGLVQQCQHWQDKSQFQFMLYWNVVYNCKDCRLFLGEIINNQEPRNKSSKISDMSYYMCIVDGTDKPKKVLRKFHFDYVTGRAGQRERHPRFHLQYCGGLPLAMKNLGITDELMELLEPHVDGPRIFFTPMTLGLLMNMAFYEFPCDATEEIRKRGDWQNLVRENEKRILIPFYQKCVHFAGNEDFVFFDEVYVGPKASTS